MDDAGPAHAADADRLSPQWASRALTRVLSGLPGGRMDDQTCRFVQHQEVGIFVEYVEIDRLGLGLRRLRLRDVDNEALTRLTLRDGSSIVRPSASAPGGFR